MENIKRNPGRILEGTYGEYREKVKRNTGRILVGIQGE